MTRQKIYVVESEDGPVLEYISEVDVLDSKGSIMLSKDEGRKLYRELKKFYEERIGR